MSILNVEVVEKALFLLEEVCRGNEPVENLEVDEGSCVFLQHAAGFGWREACTKKEWEPAEQLWQEWKNVWKPKIVLYGDWWFDVNRIITRRDRIDYRIAMFKAYISGDPILIHLLREDMYNRGII